MAEKYVKKGSIRGPEGPQGPAGEAGPIGRSMFVSTVDILSNTDVNKTDIKNPDGIAVNDIIFDTNGDTYIVTAVKDAAVHVSNATGVNLKGPKGDGSDVTIATTDKVGVVKPGSDFDISDDGTITLYKAISITSFTGGTTVELGSTVDSVSLAWNYSKEPTTLQLDKVDVDKANGVFVKTKALTGLGLKANKTYTLTATDARGASSTKTTSVLFKLKRYWGVGNPADAKAITNEFVLGLAGSELSDNKTKDFTVNAAGGNYIFYAIPASYGTPVFYVGGFEGGFNLVKTFDFTNASGHVESYNVWKSGNPDLGQTTVNVK